jgi:hypothetical protein
MVSGLVNSLLRPRFDERKMNFLLGELGDEDIYRLMKKIIPKIWDREMRPI